MYINIILFYSLIKRDNNAMRHTISGVICIKLHINADSKKQFLLIIQILSKRVSKIISKNYTSKNNSKYFSISFRKKLKNTIYRYESKLQDYFSRLLYVNLRPSLGYGYAAIKINESDERIARESRV